MLEISLKKATLADLKKLQKIGIQTFSDSFSGQNTAEDMQSYLDETFSSENLTLELNDSNSDIYFAEFQENVIGYIKINFGKSQTHLKDESAIQIERLYISKDHQRKNVGQFLLNKALEIAQNTGKDYVWLGVWTENKRAIKFYERNNFVEFGSYIFTLGTDKQSDIMMKYTFEN